jgi:hypothetical protein
MTGFFSFISGRQLMPVVQRDFLHGQPGSASSPVVREKALEVETTLISTDYLAQKMKPFNK